MNPDTKAAEDIFARCRYCNGVLAQDEHSYVSCINRACPRYRKGVMSEVFGPNGENPLTSPAVVFGKFLQEELKGDTAPITRSAQAESVVEWMSEAERHIYKNRKLGETMAEAERLDKEKGQALKEGETITNSAGAKQSFIAADYECIPPVVLRLLAQCLGFGRRKYGFENWKNIPFEDNLNHAMNHIVEWRMGDRSEPHLVNAMARLTFALTQAVESNQQPPQYIRTDE